eukprot:TRINITY_DN5207_c0_g1_i1.p1 TRINITY_DN5207_c0_g1~~TRINITY_DN5207_c0_g1_i1.p1  ORF type:complete len:137 (+),score=31.07 TRINITY_DN5207_c0_g1_i1:42-452(+)
MSIQSMGILTATISLVEEVDKKILVVLRDGRKLVGTMRAFDQFANVVLEDSIERTFVGNKYCEKHLGLFVIRGENVLLLGEIDPEHDQKVMSELEQLPTEELMQLYKLEKKKQDEQEQLKRTIQLGRGLHPDYDDL